MNMNKNNAFVFVVCGGQEHLDTLKLSYRVLSEKASSPIFIVTDNRRNDYPLIENSVLDVETPKNFTNHQASIWLKTNLHNILPKGNTYAYLDTDILAIGKNPDNIFNQFIAPIRFADDHCLLPQFSAYATNCPCLDQLEHARNMVKEVLSQADPLSLSEDLTIIQERKKLNNIVDEQKNKKIKFYIRYLLSWPIFRLNEEFHLNKKTKTWHNKNGIEVMHHIGMRQLAKRTGLRWNIFQNQICLKDGRNIYVNSCDHLRRAIRDKWGINVSQKEWQHWNGGVFIFTDESHEFMTNWHKLTMEIFEDPSWKTRDQGTLIATVWKLGLQDHSTLDNKWNLILDYYNNKLEYLGEGAFTVNGKKQVIPEFVHIYHHWEDKEWAIWNTVMQLVRKEN